MDEVVLLLGQSVHALVVVQLDPQRLVHTSLVDSVVVRIIKMYAGQYLKYQVNVNSRLLLVKNVSKCNSGALELGLLVQTRM